MQSSVLSTPAWACLSAKAIQTPQQVILLRLVQQPSRNLTYISLKKGKRKSVKSVVKRFMRLHCGLWIRRKAGYKKKLEEVACKKEAFKGACVL
ncbi:39S ribosomal protein L35, mitochondrial [Salmo salar]|uniref:39S ribosomal protein L35, mitochondrial n=1 Tax=Salmo salar TaxID=8030 RepID=A0A1S3SPI6_SALSA|nr:39S ribosomal protein L35, mitochondrial-like [Salmo salar]|eukprot:XP_014066248.1 PREDICTED: 39S ribosomal protein L35, mitochondrial-like [Salmo salar]